MVPSSGEMMRGGGRRRRRRRRRQVDSKTWPIFPSTLSVRIQQLMVRINTETIVFFSSSVTPSPSPSSLLHCRTPEVSCALLSFTYIRNALRGRSLARRFFFCCFTSIYLLRVLQFLNGAMRYTISRLLLPLLLLLTWKTMVANRQTAGCCCLVPRLQQSSREQEEDGAEEAKTGEEEFSHCVNLWMYFLGVLYYKIPCQNTILRKVVPLPSHSKEEEEKEEVFNAPSVQLLSNHCGLKSRVNLRNVNYLNCQLSGTLWDLHFDFSNRDLSLSHYRPISNKPWH